MRAKFQWECPIGNWDRLRKCWRTCRIISNTVQNAKKTYSAGLENTAIPHFWIKITEIPQEKFSNTPKPNGPLLGNFYLFYV